MNNAGSKTSFIGIMLCALVSGARAAAYLAEIITHKHIIFATSVYMMYAVIFGLALLIAGYAIKYFNNKDIFDLITMFTVMVTLAVTMFPAIIFRGKILGDIINLALSNLYLLGVAVNFFRKGKQAPCIILTLMFVYFSVLYPIAMYLIFGGGVGGVMAYAISIFNNVLTAVTLGLAAVSVVNDD